MTNNIKPTIWIDMSDFSVWEGHFTGIQRVVFNIGLRFYNANKARYFYFDSNKAKFYEYDFESLAKSMEPDNKKTVSGVLSKKQIIITKTKSLYIKSPNTLKRVLPPQRAKKIALTGKRLYVNLRHLKNGAKSKLKGHNQIDEVAFNKDDTVIILGNSWDRPNLLPELGGLKKSISFKIYQVIYDLIPIFQPQAFNKDLYDIYTNNMFEVATISDGLFSISKSSKKDFEKFCDILKIDCPKISVIRLGDDIPTSVLPKAPDSINSRQKFILCVGTIEARKNHALLYYSWKEALNTSVDIPDLVIVGRKGWYTDNIIHTMKNDPQVKDKIKILNNVSDDELVWLYEHCIFTIYPSYYEGWGLPVAESLAMGKFCISSNASSMPEIGGELVGYFSPYNSGQLLEQIVKYLNDIDIKKAEERIKHEYAKHSWDTTYKQLEDIINC